MSLELIRALRAEIQALEADLKSDPRLQKLEDAKRLLERYTESGFIMSPRSWPRRVVQATRVTPRSPERQNILTAAESFIAGRPYPTTTADIFRYVASKMEIPGNNPKNNLSAMLSNSSRFRSHGRSGWTLISESLTASDTLFEEEKSEAVNSFPDLPAGEPDVRPVDPVPGGGA